MSLVTEGSARQASTAALAAAAAANARAAVQQIMSRQGTTTSGANGLPGYAAIHGGGRDHDLELELQSQQERLDRATGTEALLLRIQGDLGQLLRN